MRLKIKRFPHGVKNRLIKWEKDKGKKKALKVDGKHWKLMWSFSFKKRGIPDSRGQIIMVRGGCMYYCRAFCFEEWWVGQSKVFLSLKRREWHSNYSQGLIHFYIPAVCPAWNRAKIYSVYRKFFQCAFLTNLKKLILFSFVIE